MWLISCPFSPFLLNLSWFPPAAVADGVCHRAVPFLILEDRAGHRLWVSVTEGSSLSLTFWGKSRAPSTPARLSRALSSHGAGGQAGLCLQLLAQERSGCGAFGVLLQVCTYMCT